MLHILSTGPQPGCAAAACLSYMRTDLHCCLVCPEQDAVGAGKAPHHEQQEEQVPADVIHHGLQAIHKGEAHWSKHTARQHEQHSNTMSNTVLICLAA